MKELKNLFSGIQDREQPLEERHLREIECLQSAQREEKSSKGASSAQNALFRKTRFGGCLRRGGGIRVHVRLSGTVS